MTLPLIYLEVNFILSMFLLLILLKICVSKALSRYLLIEKLLNECFMNVFRILSTGTNSN